MNVRDASRPVQGGVEIDISALPNSDRQGTDGMNEWRKRITVRVRSPPADGKANREIEEFFRNMTGCRCGIVNGHSVRRKTVMIQGDADAILRTLEDSL